MRSSATCRRALTARVEAKTGPQDSNPGKVLTFRRAFARLDAAAEPSGRIPVRLMGHSETSARRAWSPPDRATRPMLG